MRKSSKIIAAAAIAGFAALGGAALTDTGLSTSGQAAAPQFIGGTVTQAVTGGTLSNVAYTFSDGTDTAITSIALTFTAADDVHVAAAGSGGGPGTFTCTDVATGASTCTYVPVAAEAGYVGLTGLAVTAS